MRKRNLKKISFKGEFCPHDPDVFCQEPSCEECQIYRDKVINKYKKSGPLQ